MSPQDERYSRQLVLKGFGPRAQEKLSASKVLVIGAGGLGCAALQYLAAAGVGTLGIADGDTVQRSNLHRQVLYGQSDIGRLKVDVASERLKAMNDQVKLQCWASFWNNELSIRNFGEYDIIIDATDNFSSRYLINDACLLMKKPLVFGAVSGYEGQVALFLHKSYRDIFPIPPTNDEVPNCEEGGVLGVLPGIIGVMQATEAIKWITGVGKSLEDQLLTYSAREQQMYTVDITGHPFAALHCPSSIEQYLQTNYVQLCTSRWEQVVEITEEEWRNDFQDGLLVDVRERDELPRLEHVDHLTIPFSELKDDSLDWSGHKVIFICQTGLRSRKAAHRIGSLHPGLKIYSLKGGIRELFKK